MDTWMDGGVGRWRDRWIRDGWWEMALEIGRGWKACCLWIQGATCGMYDPVITYHQRPKRPRVARV